MEDEESPQVCLSLLIRCSNSFLLRFSIILYFVSLFLFIFFLGGKDDVLFKNAVERNFQSFNLSSAVQYYS